MPPGVGAVIDLVGAVDVHRRRRHVGVAVLEPGGRIGVLPGLVLHVVGQARRLSRRACGAYGASGRRHVVVVFPDMTQRVSGRGVHAALL